ncbi:MAG TPA: cyclic nucleotide-binding domain-containing protein [Candidatus Ozemobacteraceae bacterium]|nr:cyclic nucleotide-binding domain-containing protein [Candidatus Ozemobacteraceae bacterium]
MDNIHDLATFNPGEPVYFQGERRREFYGLHQGRFAKVLLPAASGDTPLAGQLARATLVEIIDQPGQVFGEIDALLNKPQEYSVFALDPSGVMPIPAVGQSLRDKLAEVPQVGIKTCISLARNLHQAIERFSRLVQQEEELQRLQLTSARALLAAINEVEQLGGATMPAIAAVLEFARNHKAFELAAQLTAENRIPGVSPSIYNAVMRPPETPEQTQRFSTGSILCRKGSIGDKLFILLEGVVEVVLGPNHRVQIARPGSIFGEIAVLLNLEAATPEMRRTADVVCATPVSAIVIGLDQAAAFFREKPEILTNLLFALTDRMEETLQLENGIKRRLNELLFQELRHLLEAHHGIALRLNGVRERHLAMERPFNFCAHQSRQIYTSFAATLDTFGLRSGTSGN